MTVHAGDQVIVQGPKVGAPSRSGQVVEVLAHDGGEHYRVRWDDDQHESIFFPSSDTRIEQPDD